MKDDEYMEVMDPLSRVRMTSREKAPLQWFERRVRSRGLKLYRGESVRDGFADSNTVESKLESSRTETIEVTSPTGSHAVDRFV